MKVEAERKRLLDGINAVKDVVRAGDETSALRNIRVESGDGRTLLLTGSNGAVQVQARVECETDGTGAFTLAGARFAAFASALTADRVTLEEGRGARAAFADGTTRFTLAKGGAEDFPVMPGPDAGKSAKAVLKAAEFGRMLKLTAYAASRDETRATLRAVALQMRAGNLLAVATDGRRLSSATADGDYAGTADFDAVLPPDAVKTLAKLLGRWPEGEVDIETDGAKARFTGSAWSVTATLSGIPYPNWRNVVPEGLPNEARVNGLVLMAALGRARLAANAEYPSVTVRFARGEGGKPCARLTANGSLSHAETCVPCEYDGPETELTFDPELLLQPLGALESADVRLRFRDGESPLVIRNGLDDSFVGVVMTMRRK